MENVFRGSFTEDTTRMEGHTEGIPHFGIQGPPGPQGGYYTPSITQPDDNTLEFEFIPSKLDMPAVEPVQVELPHSGGNVDQEQITAAVNEALAEAKASGEFDGKDGTDGKDGQDGYTPQKGIDYFDGTPGKDGADGKDGYTPVKGVDYFDGSPGKDGKDGNPGADGYTPIKGKDYFDGEDGQDGSPGKDGITPHVGSNGNWFIGDNDTGIPATGPAGGQGLPGTPGEDGKDGKDGADGKSAYQYAKDGGYTGTEAEFAEKLASESSGIHIGTDAPTDENINVWIDTDEEAPVVNPGGGAPADWNATEGEPGHVLNRTHWVDVQKNKVFLDTTVSASEVENNMAIIALDGELQAGKTYTVTLSGQQYTCECKYGFVMGNLSLCLGNPYAYGGEPSDEPFAILYFPWMNWSIFVPLFQADEYIIKIEGEERTYRTLRSEFLPKPIWLIDFLMPMEGNAPEHIDVSQIELNRAVENGELVALRGRWEGNRTISLYYFDFRSQDGEFYFRQLAAKGGIVLTPNESGGYDPANAN